MERKEDLEKQLEKVERKQCLAEVVGGALLVGGLFASFPLGIYLAEIREYSPPIVLGMGMACCAGPILAAVVGALHYEEKAYEFRKQLDELDQKGVK